MSTERKGFEFDKGVKQYVYQRAKGRCEWVPEKCKDRATSIDHITSIAISALLNGGRPDKIVKTPSNAQALCDWHNRFKTYVENWMTRQLQIQVSR